MQTGPLAVMDLGSNTFHLLVFRWEESRIVQEFSLSLPAKIGLGSFGDGGIQPEAMDRALVVLHQFKRIMEEWQVTKYRAIGTSALRQAANQAVFLARVEREVGLRIEVISGVDEASFIFEGVQMAVPITSPSLVLDIGGGSVEFILTDDTQVVWKKSLEIGGLRLMEKFHRFDPMPLASQERMRTFLREQLLPVTNAVHQYAPQVLVGSSGSFDTLVDMWWMKTTGQFPPEDQSSFTLSLDAFVALKGQILPLAEPERRELPGMIPLRSGMISIAMVLIDHVLLTYQLEKIHVSRYSLKEGVCQTLKP